MLAVNDKIKDMILAVLAIVIGALLTIIVSNALINDVQANFFILYSLLHLKHSLMVNKTKYNANTPIR